jgi:hypothetical protein
MQTIETTVQKMTPGQKKLSPSFGIFILPALWLCSACNWFAPSLPVQATRITQLEPYYQSYQLCNDADQVFTALLGASNRKSVSRKSPQIWENYVKSAKQNKFYVAGHVVFTFSIYPLNVRQFFVEGHGRHMVYDSTTGELIASSEFVVVDDGPHWLSDLRRGSLTIRISEQTAREFVKDRERVVHTGEVFVRVYVTAFADAFSIDYGADHDIGIEDPNQLTDGVLKAAAENEGAENENVDGKMVVSREVTAANGIGTIADAAAKGAPYYRGIRRIGTMHFVSVHHPDCVVRGRTVNRRAGRVPVGLG